MKATSERIKIHKKSGYGVPVAHTCKDGDMESTENCPACKWLREQMEKNNVIKAELKNTKSGKVIATATFTTLESMSLRNNLFPDCSNLRWMVTEK